jgi:hypothetical protein
LPSEPPPPPVAALLEAFAVAGPFGPDAVAGAGFLTPVLPVVTPLLPLAEDGTGKNGAVISELLVEIANEEDTLFAPFDAYISQGNQSTIDTDQKLLTALGPVLHLAEGIPDLDCVGVLELAAGYTIDPSAYPGGTSLLGSAAGANQHESVASFSTSWSQGITPSLQKTLSALEATGEPVELHLVDAAPLGQQGHVDGFADWVGQVIAANPKVAIFEVDPPRAGTLAPDDPLNSLADAVDTAAQSRALGQLIGVGLPAPLASAPWWSELSEHLSPAVLARINFMGVDATELGPNVSPSSLRWMLGLLRQGMLKSEGFSSELPFFVTVGSAGSDPLATQIASAAAYARSLSGIGVGLLSWSDTSSAALAPGGMGPIMEALVRTPSP